MTPPRPPASADLDIPDVDIEMPEGEIPEARGAAEELNALRKQAAEMQQSLELLLKRIEELEANRSSDGDT